MTDATRARLLTECNATRATWKEATASFQTFAYLQYVNACRALVEYDREHPKEEQKP